MEPKRALFYLETKKGFFKDSGRSLLGSRYTTTILEKEV
jgi:hypothetical protein